MNNFEKFNNKQISQVESSKVMGGGYEECLFPGPGDFCLSFAYNYNISVLGCSLIDMGPIAYRECLDFACDYAQAECTIG